MLKNVLSEFDISGFIRKFENHLGEVNYIAISFKLRPRVSLYSKRYGLKRGGGEGGAGVFSPSRNE